MTIRADIEALIEKWRKDSETIRSNIGPLHGIGWAEALKYCADNLEALREVPEGAGSIRLDDDALVYHLVAGVVSCISTEQPPAVRLEDAQAEVRRTLEWWNARKSSAKGE